MSDDTYNIYEIFGSASSHARPSSENHVTEVPVYEGVVPVIFVPGVMGSNLINTASRKTWRLDGPGSASGWLFTGAGRRKEILDPEQTEVDPGGEIEDGLSRIWRTRDGKIIENETLMRARGWGEVARMSYGEFLVWLERNLNDPSIIQRWNVRDRMKQQLQQDGQLPEGDIDALAEQCGVALQRFHYPVHACGYNWLRSNKDSAESDLGRRVDEIMMGYQSAGHRCDRVILVTHSMGGLVARYYSEVRSGSSKIAGIVHGVMPTIGASVFYRRMKCGTDGAWPASDVLGATARETTAVLAGAPGPLQLVPTPEYGRNWLKIFKDGTEQLSLPTENDPYSEIYLARDKWWSMMETELANPAVGRRSDGPEKELALQLEWGAYAKIITFDVATFHQKMACQFHDATYMFYSGSDEFMSYGDVSWTGSPFNLSPATAVDSAGPYSTQRRVTEEDARGQSRLYQYTISGKDEPGDGTVPLRSGKSGTDYAQRSLVVSVEHEPAYNDDDARWFTLGSILEIASRIGS